MKFSFCLPALLLSTATILAAGNDDAARRANLVILDETAVRNLGLATAPVVPADFEETIFALGQIEVLPGRRAVVSSRVAGRALEVRAMHDHAITQGEVAVVLESRQFGEPPPRLELTAPLSGTVSATHVVPGQPVAPDDVLVEILDLTDVYAIARVPDHFAARLKRGQKARITAAATGAEVFDATLEHLGVVADAASGTVEAAFRVKNPQLLLRPGLRVQFAIITDRHTGVTSVPKAAIQGEGASRFVYVRDFEVPNAFTKAPVVLGRSNDQSVEIVSGLFPADEVVTRGGYALASAGGGTLSLKEALDAAHGHAHNADGSEIKNAADGAAGSASPSHSHSHSHERVWMIISGVLLVALVAVATRLRRATAARRHPGA